jgi:hypothetical protein
MPENEPLLERLADEILDTIEAYQQRHPQLTTGNVMGALFGILIGTAKSSPQFNAESFMDEVVAKLREAVGN